ncbi:Zn(II)2Cys6 transcription factor [Aspergillus homomorphus CBS 101889]|uniref:Putative fungal-specific transcription factor n=1 Tax=Aspergillus homomorphus (strain CBS 101889) TaxID=1450537 RepID=A0A395HZJ4_ASPHC|nr:putative fungal-specific transcription factor [Aspergillus homomorphus CBS 101889]RAL13362.1 putative fungal-specific transcription factor [Aspergillus homomorphus CBS 101889]
MPEPGLPRRVGRQKRPPVPESARKRAAKACVPCRYHKEKCGGGVPCARCRQYNRACRFEITAPQPVSRQTGNHATGLGSSSHAQDREAVMLRIIRHFMGDVASDTSSLRSIADGLEKRSPDHDGQVLTGITGPEPESYSLEPLSSSTMHYYGELSHWNFSQTLRRRLRSLGSGTDQNYGADTVRGTHRATGLQSSTSVVSSAMAYFPPRDIADFLTETFLQYAQTNYFYFDERTLRQKMDHYYSNEHALTIHDAGWIGTLLMTFAIGTQFAYMQTKPIQMSPHVPSEIPDDRVGLELYRFSCRLIPDLVTVASVETVQAFLLLGSYTLPIDTGGLAYTYYGLAIKMAIQNGMHRDSSQLSLDSDTIEWRNRLWWSAYSLESRISILHGRPVSISHLEVDAHVPTDRALPLPTGRASNLHNVNANIFLTGQLGKVSQTIMRLRGCPRPQQKGHLHDLMVIRSSLAKWWSSLPTEVHCRDLTPTGPLFRCNVHLELSYDTVIIYMGRPFIFTPKPAHSVASEPHNESPIYTLATDCLDAAIRIIELCQLLHDSVGIARVSYTEFSSCRAALLALIAHSLNTQTDRILNTLSQGMTLIRQMCVGVESARSDVAALEAMEHARQRLQQQGVPSEPGNLDIDLGYSQFQRWAQLWESEPPSAQQHSSTTDATFSEFPDSLTPPSFDGFFASLPQEVDSFATITGSDQLFLDDSWLGEPGGPILPAEGVNPFDI